MLCAVCPATISASSALDLPQSSASVAKGDEDEIDTYASRERQKS